MVIPSDEERNIRRLLNDRIEFKLYSAEQHLNRLKEIENVYGDIGRYSARIEVEMEVDCFLSQLVGAVDSLLFEINNKLDLGIPSGQINFANVQSALNAKTKIIDLLFPLDKARQEGMWFFTLSEMRNQLIHGNFLRKVIPANDAQQELSQVPFLNLKREFQQDKPLDHDMDMDLIKYLERSLEQVRELIFSIRSAQPLLEQEE
ncbi:MAG: hypothetical protein M3270_08070 [Thermoproteota archaeon]|nr:hypothetical protein [Thermoproteota archaeon]